MIKTIHYYSVHNDGSSSAKTMTEKETIHHQNCK